MGYLEKASQICIQEYEDRDEIMTEAYLSVVEDNVMLALEIRSN